MSFSDNKSRTSAILPDGSLNLKFLERDISQDIASNNLYKAEDDMKKRAIHCSSNYDEFKSFVKCSQLKPIKNGEINQLFQPNPAGISRVTVFNKTASKKKFSILDQITQSNCSPLSKTNQKYSKRSGDLDTKINDVINKKSTNDTSPSNAMELKQYWCTNCLDLSDKSHFLLFQTNPKIIAKIFRQVELNNELLEEFIETLYYITQNFEELLIKKTRKLNSDLDSATENSNDNLNTKLYVSEIIYQWLKTFTKCNRFSININFLSEKHTHFLSFILNEFLSQSVAQKRDNNAGSGSNLMRESSIEKLRKIYGTN